MMNMLLAAEWVAPVVIVCVVLVLLIVLFSALKVVPQAHEYVIEFLGKYKTTWKAGLHALIPFVERIARKVTSKEQVLDSKPQPVITKDNVTVNVDSVVYFYVFDSERYTYGAVDPINALENLAATTLRNIIGTMELDSTLTSRDFINGKMETILDEATDKWGIKVTRVEIRNIMLPKEIQGAMEKQMKAEREKREAILLAEAHQESVVKRAEGEKRAMVLQAEGERDARIARATGEAEALRLKQEAEAKAIEYLNAAAATPQVLELKRFEAMKEVARGTAAKIIVPTDVMNVVKNGVLLGETMGIGNVTEEAKRPATPVKPDPCCDDKPATKI